MNPPQLSAPPGWRVKEGADIDPFHHLNGPFYIADPFEPTAEEAVRLGFRVSSHNCSYSGHAHGGWLSAILDVSLGLNVQAGCAVPHAPTISLTIDFMRGALPGDWLESRVRLLRVTRSLAFCDGVLMGADGTVARANGVFKLPSSRPAQAK
ncbi:PaaI family thioesterase [Sphingobium chlorophenolicum]|uniref:Thioesterase superfamily protein n=1 Tax=Sphingobium chlorophenolicum TaxID=46429 RepID=A0A081RF55_SPHCR|nr:PaaI family thioesterase [Sphingobium chlorophenolicum]KEQ53828.1 Thioesterase superfamily protein [Sphingobium chlorophenolicum]